MRIIITGVLIALKIAGVGSYSWWLPVGIFVVLTLLEIFIAWISTSDDHTDWHKGMFD